VQCGDFCGDSLAKFGKYVFSLLMLSVAFIVNATEDPRPLVSYPQEIKARVMIRIKAGEPVKSKRFGLSTYFGGLRLPGTDSTQIISRKEFPL